MQCATAVHEVQCEETGRNFTAVRRSAFNAVCRITCPPSRCRSACATTNDKMTYQNTYIAILITHAPFGIRLQRSCRVSALRSSGYSCLASSTEKIICVLFSQLPMSGAYLQPYFRTKCSSRHQSESPSLSLKETANDLFVITGRGEKSVLGTSILGLASLVHGGARAVIMYKSSL